MRRSVVFAFAAMLACFAVDGRAAEPAEIRLGTVTDLSGPAAPYGHAVVNALRLRFDAVNAAGGVRGRRIRLIVEDHQFQVPRAVQAAAKLIKRDRVQAFVGALGTAQVQAMLPQLREAGIPNLFPMAASRDLVQASDAITWISGSLYYDQIRAGVKWMVEQRGKRAVCALAQNTDYGEEIQQALRDQLGFHGLSLLAVATHRPTDTDFTAAIARLRAANCDLVVLATLLRDTLLPMAAAKAAGWNVDFLGPSTTHDYLLAAAPGNATQGLYSVSSIALPDRASAAPDVLAWIEAYAARFGSAPNAGAIYGATIADLAVLTLDRLGDRTGDRADGGRDPARFARAVGGISGWRDLFGGTVQDFSDGRRQGTKQAYVWQLQGPRYQKLTDALGY